MKKTIFLSAMIAAFSITATYAQDAPQRRENRENREARPGGERRGQGRDMMAIYQDLKLTKEQEAKIKTINEEQRTKFQELRNDNSLSDEAKRTKMREMQKARQEKINTVLTKEQQEKLAAKMKERGNRGSNQKSTDKKDKK